MKPAGVLFLALALPVCSEGKAGSEQELNKLQGTWKVTAIEVDGKPQAKDKAPAEFKIAGNKLTGLGPDMTITLDPTKKPKWIDLTFKKGDKSIPIRAIYALEGDELKLSIPLAPVGKAFKNQRPENFETEGEPVVLFKAKRKSKKE
jgi:uncharacterized protein (TIGR03067 family)